MRKTLKVIMLIPLFANAFAIFANIYNKNFPAIFQSVLAVVCIIVIFKSNKNAQILANKKIMWIFPAFYCIPIFSDIFSLNFSDIFSLQNISIICEIAVCLMLTFLWLDIFFAKKALANKKTVMNVVCIVLFATAICGIYSWWSVCMQVDWLNINIPLFVSRMVMWFVLNVFLAFYYCKLLVDYKQMIVNDTTYIPSLPKPPLEPKWIAFKISTTIFIITYTFLHSRMFFVNPTAGTVLDIVLIVNLAFIWINRDNINALKVNLFLMILQLSIIAIQSVYILVFNIPLYEMGGYNALFLWAFFAFAVLLWLWLAGIFKIKNINVIKYSALAVGVLYLGWTIISMYMTTENVFSLYDQNADTFLRTAFFTAVNVGYIFLVTKYFDTTPKEDSLDEDDI